jgi:hypothetical protein
MSIPAIALNYLTLRTLRGSTLAGDDILDNPADPIPSETLLRPVIAVYVGNDSREDTDGTGALLAVHEIDVSIQIFLPAAMTIRIDGKDVELSTRFGAAPIAFGTMMTQIELAMYASDDEAPRLFRELTAPGPSKIETNEWLLETKPQSSGGIRIPAYEISYSFKTCASPFFFDGEVSPFWNDVIALMENDPDAGYQAVAGLIRASIAGGVGMPKWRVEQADLGLSNSAADGIRLTQGPDFGGGEPDIIVD